MWMVVYVAEQKSVADHIEKILSDEGILVKVRCANKDIEGSNCLYEILVLQSEINESYDVLMEHEY